MPRRRVLCAGGCGRLLLLGSGSLPNPTCRPCRRVNPRPSGPRGGGRPAVPCPMCATPFVPVHTSRGTMTATCSRRCAGLLRNGHTTTDPALLYASRRAADVVRCARRRGLLLLVEAVEPLKVFERDGWRCHLCGRRIDRRLSGRARMGPTLDHLVPVSQGGEHSYANVRAAHRACNSGRGVGGAVQLALIG